MIRVGDEKFYPSFSQNSIFGKKGGQNTKNQLKSRIEQTQQMIKVGDKNFIPRPP